MVLVKANISRGALQKAGWESIRLFVGVHRGLLAGRVLDFGCGRPVVDGSHRYRDLVSGEYCPYDPHVPGFTEFPAGRFDAILTTSVLTCVADPIRTVEALRNVTNPGGVWVATYNASWYEFEPSSGEIWRFAREGMERLLAGSRILASEPILRMQMNGWALNMTYGIVVRWN